MVKEITYTRNDKTNKLFKVDDFVINPEKLLHGVDRCGDCTFGDNSDVKYYENVLVENRDNNSGRLFSVIIKHHGRFSTNEGPIKFRVDGADVKLSIGSGIEFYRTGDDLSFSIGNFPI